MRKRELLLLVIYKLQKKGIGSRRAILKSLFILKKEYDIDRFMKFYSFYPYKQGPFSQLCYADLRSLKQDGLIDDQEVRLTDEGIGKLSKLPTKLDYAVNGLLDRFDSEAQITDYVYSNYPEYTVRSELIHQEDPKAGAGFFTIGYEQRDIDNFLDAAIQNGIDMIVDVRKNAFSMNFSFAQKKLKSYLEGAKIEYVHMPELGIESEDRKNLNTKKDYDILFEGYRKRLPSKRAHINELIGLGKEKKIALLCFEKDVEYCHRGQIADELRNLEHNVTDL
jgi:uncharacterized protein (DUF488 family)